MTSASILLSKDDNFCFICLDVFNLAVTIPCGHTFSMIWIKRHWDVRRVCPLCVQCFSSGPELQLDALTSGIVPQFGAQEDQEAEAVAVACGVCEQRALKSCLVCLTSYCAAHLRLHRTVPGLRRHELTDPVANLEDRICDMYKKNNRRLKMFWRRLIRLGRC